jgi:hypothetical protein
MYYGGAHGSVKPHCWAELLRTVADEDDNLTALLLEALYSMVQAQSNVKPVILVQSWRETLPDLEDDFWVSRMKM